MENSEARKRRDEENLILEANSIVEQVLDGEGSTINLAMTPIQALMAVGDLLSASLQLLAQFVEYAHEQAHQSDESEHE